MREKLYSLIGFQPCGEIPFPPALAARKLTNPDAPKSDHCILLDADSGPVWAVPILFSKVARCKVETGGTFFQYVQLKFLVVQRPPTPSGKGSYDVNNPQLLDIDQVHGFYEQVGRNTNYIIHPEEILADNFQFLILGKTGLPSPQIVRNLAGALGLRADDAR